MQVVSRPKHLIFIAKPSPCGNQRDHGEALKRCITKSLRGGQLPWKVSPLALDLYEQDTNVCSFNTLRCWGCFLQDDLACPMRSSALRSFLTVRFLTGLCESEHQSLTPGSASYLNRDPVRWFYL